jgi:hypothetical protein
MLKPLTMGLGLAVALGLSSVSLAGGHHKAMPSAQDPAPAVASPQGVLPTSQDVGAGCEDVLAGPVKKGCGLLNLFKPKPKCYTYEWVLKKKRVRHGLFGGLCGGGDNAGCGEPSCGSCGDATPSAQWASPQGELAAPQAMPAAQGPYGAAQGGYGAAPAGQYLPTSAAGQYAPTAAGAPQLLNSAPAAAPVAAPVVAPAPAGDPALEPPPPPRPADAEKTSAVDDGLLLLPAGN